MIEGIHPLFQAMLGTLFTWGVTAAGSALVFVFKSGQRKILDASLGFAAGVMTAASYWSLLSPAIEMASTSGVYGEKGQFAFVPVAIGFAVGAAFVYGADKLMPFLGISDPTIALAVSQSYDSSPTKNLNESTITFEEAGEYSGNPDRATSLRQRGPLGSTANFGNSVSENTNSTSTLPFQNKKSLSWKRILLLIVAITVHNIPEGLAVGVGFGAIGKSAAATFENARNLAIGIGIQNFPEGLAVSLPLRGSGMSTWKSFWYGQLSGMVEPIAGILGAAAVVVAEPILPYALAFAAGAMIYVVVDDIVPEAQMCGNGTLASAGCIFGFIVMMSLDVGLG